MAALPYMQFYVADYLADTMHLSTEEHGAYLLLIFNYWQTGKPIPKARLHKIARMSKDKWAEIEPALDEFFTDDGDRWVHLRIEADLDAVNTKPRGKQLPNGESLTGYNGYVYFVAGDDSGLVKVGYSKNPWARLSELRRDYGSSLEILATLKTRSKSEANVHKSLRELHDHDEWFHLSAPLKSAIDAVSVKKITTVDEFVATVETNYETTNTDQIRSDKNRTDKREDTNGTSAGADDAVSDRKRDAYPDDFEQAWAEYPKREGGNPKKAAFKAWKARRKAGVPADELLNATRRYAQHCLAHGKAGTSYVKQGSTFYGPDEHYRESYSTSPPKPPDKGRSQSHSGFADREYTSHIPDWAKQATGEMS